MREISCQLFKHLTQLFESLPDKKEWQTEHGMVLDGVFQMIRMYGNDSIIKEYAYFNCENDLLNDFYEAVEAEIKGEAE